MLEQVEVRVEDLLSSLVVIEGERSPHRIRNEGCSEVYSSSLASIVNVFDMGQGRGLMGGRGGEHEPGDRRSEHGPIKLDDEYEARQVTALGTTSWEVSRGGHGPLVSYNHRSVGQVRYQDISKLHVD